MRSSLKLPSFFTNRADETLPSFSIVVSNVTVPVIPRLRGERLGLARCKQARMRGRIGATAFSTAGSRCGPPMFGSSDGSPLSRRACSRDARHGADVGGRRVRSGRGRDRHRLHLHLGLVRGQRRAARRRIRLRRIASASSGDQREDERSEPTGHGLTIHPKVPGHMRDFGAFVRSHTRVVTVPFVPEIRIHTATEVDDIWHATEAWLAERDLNVPFWCVPWAGGQALARYVLDHPAVVAGKRVLDFGTGSGLVAIAACLAGAAHVRAVDVDRFCGRGIVHLETRKRTASTSMQNARISWVHRSKTDVLLAGDVLPSGTVGPRRRPVSARGSARSRATCSPAIPRARIRPPKAATELARYEVPTTVEPPSRRTSRTTRCAQAQCALECGQEARDPCVFLSFVRAGFVRPPSFARSIRMRRSFSPNDFVYPDVLQRGAERKPKPIGTMPGSRQFRRRTAEKSRKT